ncbi:MAG TPA: hypothetical protein G4O04_10790 [Anaerolineae bacterium]|nr:hypothetical protein [Anaerolineae bacterium]HIQ08603.1 hypothetical protein [Anaerolineaceae bacterium]
MQHQRGWTATVRRSHLWLGMVVLLGVWALTACATAIPTPTPMPTPTAPTFLVVAHPPDLTPWDADLQRCARTWNLPLVVHEVALRALPTTEADVVLTWGAPPAEAHAFALGEETVWAVTSRTNPVRDLSPAQVRWLFLGWVTDWRDFGGRAQGVRLWAPDEDDLVYPVLEDLLLGVPPASQAKVVPGPRAALEALAKVPGGVALLPGRWLVAADLPPEVASRVEKVAVLSAEPLGQTPVVAFTWEEPQGTARDLIACLQGTAPPQGGE